MLITRNFPYSICWRIALFFAILVTSACEHTVYKDEFDTVERIARCDVDSAFIILRSLPDTSVMSKYDRARYALLMAQCRYLADSIDTIPSALLSYAAFFDKVGDFHNSTRAYYYASVQSTQNLDNSRAIISLLKAEKRARIENEPFMVGLINRAIGDNYDELMEYGNALSYYEKALKMMIKYGDRKYIAYSYIDLGRVEYALEKYRDAISHFGKAFRISLNLSDSTLSFLALRYLVTTYFEEGDFKKTTETFQRLRAYCSHPELEDVQCVRNAGIAYLRLNNMDSVRSIEKMLDNCANNDSLLSYQMALMRSDFNTAHRLLQRFVNDQNVAFQDMWKRNNAKIISDYYNDEELSAEKELHNRKIIYGSILIIVLLCISLILLFLYFRIRAYRNANALALVNIKCLKNELNEKSASEQELREMHSLLQEQYQTKRNKAARMVLSSHFGILTDLCKTLDNSDDSLENENHILGDIRSSIKNLCKPDSINAMSKEIDLVMDNLISNLKSDLKRISFEEISIFIFSLLRFSPFTISFLLGINLNNLYLKKHRLKKKIENLETERKSTYLLYFIN